MRNTSLALLVVAVTAILCSCGGDGNDENQASLPASKEKTQTPANLKMPDDMSEYRGDLHRHYREVFNDSNKFQYAHAERLGIVPITDLRSAYFTNRPIVKITDTDLYIVDELQHSVPFLVPEAAQLLTDIGEAFRDSLSKKRLPRYRLKVTSLLRTPATVKRLRRVNRNATDSSAHQFATTFDISYYGFSEVGSRTNTGVRGLKEQLAEVLYDFRSRNRCMVKYEVKSSCFHITVIK